MKKIKRCRTLANIISIWLYSTDNPTPEVNRMFLDWIERDIVPTNQQIKKLMMKHLHSDRYTI